MDNTKNVPSSCPTVIWSVFLSLTVFLFPAPSLPQLQQGSKAITTWLVFFGFFFFWCPIFHFLARLLANHTSNICVYTVVLQLDIGLGGNLFIGSFW